MSIFRDALIGVVPAVERAHIAWKDAEAYDDWELIEEALYRVIVVESLVWSLADPSTTETLAHDTREGVYRSGVITLPRYGFWYPDYSSMSYIGVQADSSAQLPAAIFQSLGTEQEAFDSVTAWRVEASDGGPSPITVPWSEASFFFCHRLTDGTLRRSEELGVEVPGR
jgi:hypothetical protein